MQKDKYLSMRIVKQEMDKNVTSGKKNFRSFQSQYNHDFRFEEMDDDWLKRPNEKNKILRLDNDLENLTNINNRKKNFEKVISKWEEIKIKHKEHNKKSLHKETKPTINFLLSFSTDFDLPLDKRSEQLNCVNNFIISKYDYPIYLVQHNDEKALHYSFTILNYDKKSMRPISKQIDTSKLQDEISNWLIKHNQDYGHKRGITKEITHAKNRTIMEGKVLELNQKIESLEEDKKQIVDDNQKQLIGLEQEKKQLEDGNQKLKQDNQDLEKSKMELESRNKSLETKISSMENNIQELTTKYNEVDKNYKHSIEAIGGVIRDLNNLSISFKGKDAKGVLNMVGRYMNKFDTTSLDKYISKLIKLVDDTKTSNNNTRTQSIS